MRKFFVCGLAAAALLVSCQRDRAGLKVSVPGLSDTSRLVLTRLSVDRLIPVDTLALKNGQVACRLEGLSGTPDFYYLLLDGVRIASFTAAAGEQIEIRTDAAGKDPEILTGSEEARLFLQEEQAFSEASARFAELSVAMLQAREAGRIPEAEELQLELGRFYVRYKQQSIRWVLEHPRSLTLVPVLYRRFGEELPVFNEWRDALYFRRAYDSLSRTYPDSPYLAALLDEARSRERMMELDRKLAAGETVDFPDLSLPDWQGETRTLSDLAGKVIVLSFWTATDQKQKMFNAELKNLYARYAGRGLAVYQVSLDTDKTRWASVVRDQRLPWPSVCDGLGTASPAAAYYNISRLPALYVIGRDGTIQADRDIFDAERLETLVRKLL